MARNTLSRSLHDVGLAAWFGGTLANAVALNAAAGAAGDAKSAGRVTNAGWDRWTPVNAVAIGAHVIGSIGQLLGNRDRLAKQEGVAGMALTKTALTAAALGATYYSRTLGKTISDAGDVPVSAGTTPSRRTPPAVVEAQSRLRTMQWVIPAVTGALIVVSSYAGEQQRPSEVASGLKARLLG